MHLKPKTEVLQQRMFKTYFLCLRSAPFSGQTLQNKDSGSQMKHRRHLHCWLDWLALIFFHCLRVYNPYTPHHRHSSAIIVTQTNNTTQKKESFDSTLSNRRPGLSSVLYYKRRVRWGTELSGAEWISSALRRCQEDE